MTDERLIIILVVVLGCSILTLIAMWADSFVKRHERAERRQKAIQDAIKQLDKKIENLVLNSKVNDIKEMVREEESTGNFCMNCKFACKMDKEDYYYCSLKGLMVTYKFSTCGNYEKEETKYESNDEI